MQIQQLARITGVSPANIRRYRSAGLLPSNNVAEPDNYSESDIHALKLIKLAVDAGLGLREITSIIVPKNHADTALHFALSRVILHAHRNKLTAKSGAENSSELVALDTLVKQLRSLFFN